MNKGTKWREVLFLSVVTVGLISTACAGGSDGPSASDGGSTSDSDHTLGGSFFVVDSEVEWTGEECQGTGGYSDVRPGMDVVVKDGSGEIIATTGLKAASEEAKEPFIDQAGSVGMFESTGCLLEWSAGVDDSDFYTIEYGTRGESTFSREELDELETPWYVIYGLGAS